MQAGAGQWYRWWGKYERLTLKEQMVRCRTRATSVHSTRWRTRLTYCKQRWPGWQWERLSSSTSSWRQNDPPSRSEWLRGHAGYVQWVTCANLEVYHSLYILQSRSGYRQGWKSEGVDVGRGDNTTQGIIYTNIFIDVTKESGKIEKCKDGKWTLLASCAIKTPKFFPSSQSMKVKGTLHLIKCIEHYWKA